MSDTFVGTTGQKIERKYFKTFVLVGSAYELQGRGIEEAALELGLEVTTTPDILGYTDITVDSSAPTQTFDPNNLRVGSLLNSKLIDLIRRRAYSEMSSFTVLTVWEMLTPSSTGTYEADMETNCTIEVTSVASGDSYVGLPFTIHYSNEITAGTVVYDSSGIPTFTATSDDNL